MKKLLLTLALCASFALAQGPTPIQQTPSKLDAATQASTSATSAATITLTPNGGESVYIFSIDISNCANAAVTGTTVTTITTTNLSGSPAWTVGSGAAIGLCQPSQQMTFPTGFKSATPGTAVTIVLPTFATGQIIRVNAVWRSAP